MTRLGGRGTRRARVAGRLGGAGRPGAPARAPAPRVGSLDAVTVQLLPHLLEEGTLPPLATGGELEVAPAIYAGVVGAGRGRDRRVDRWWQDEFGTLEAAGAMLAARLDPTACGCWVDVLDVAGHLVPLNPAAAMLGDPAGGPVGEPAGERVRVEGALYLDPELAPGTAHGAAVALCRRRYRVAALRRYRRTSSAPVDPRPIGEAPTAGAVDHDLVYVADLVAVAGVRPEA